MLLFNILTDPRLIVNINKLRWVIAAFLIPCETITCFELIYLVHKFRSTNFCGLKFDVGGRQKKAACKSIIVRWGVWLLSAGAGGCYLAANLIAVSDETATTQMSSFYSTTAIDYSNFTSTQNILKFIPWCFLSVSTIYISLVAWRYGSSYAFQVHATFLNPWIILMVGSVSFSIGALIGNLYTSKAGELIYMTSIIRLLPEVVKELQVNNEALANLATLNVGAAVTHHQSIEMSPGAKTKR
jgi:hypothetical protein